MIRTGHRLLPHTADLVLEVWAPNREEGLAESVRALAAAYVEPTGGARIEVPFAVRAASDADLLVRLLEETVFLADTRGLVAVDAEVVATPSGVEGRFVAVTVDEVEAVGSAPKAIARTDLTAGADDSGWRGRVTVDV